MKQRKWSVKKLLDESGLDMDRTSLQRKLHGEQPLYDHELQALVDALQTTVAAVPSREVS